MILCCKAMEHINDLHMINLTTMLLSAYHCLLIFKSQRDIAKIQYEGRCIIQF